MTIFDHYLPKDHGQLIDHLEILHTSTIEIIKSASNADFTKTDQHQANIQHSLRVITALHNKKLKHDEHEQLNNGIYARRNWLHE